MMMMIYDRLQVVFIMLAIPKFTSSRDWLLQRREAPCWFFDMFLSRSNASGEDKHVFRPPPLRRAFTHDLHNLAYDPPAFWSDIVEVRKHMVSSFQKSNLGSTREFLQSINQSINSSKLTR